MLCSSCRARLSTATRLALSRTRPVLHRTVPSRLFSNTPFQLSNIGKAPISVPPEVTLAFHEAPPPPEKRGIGRKERSPSVHIQGPLGELSINIPPFISVDFDENSRKAKVSVEDKAVREQREMWGTVRQYLRNHILGVSEGHNTILRLVGVGYRAAIEPNAVTKQPEYPGQQFVSLKLGYSHPIELGIPKGVKASTPLPTRILLEGAEKEVVNEFAAKIRKWRVPEPYKGKGIFVNNETIQLKAKKIK